MSQQYYIITCHIYEIKYDSESNKRHALLSTLHEVSLQFDIINRNFLLNKQNCVLFMAFLSW